MVICVRSALAHFFRWPCTFLPATLHIFSGALAHFCLLPLHIFLVSLHISPVPLHIFRVRPQHTTQQQDGHTKIEPLRRLDGQNPPSTNPPHLQIPDRLREHPWSMVHPWKLWHLWKPWCPWSPRNPWIPWIRVHGLPGIHADHDRLK